MPFREIDPAEWRHRLTRIALLGPPYSWKTSSVVTFPRPTFVLSMPGEQGSGVIPKADGIRAAVWEEPTARVSRESIVTEVEKTTRAVIAGEKGPVKTLFIDGFHKLYSLMQQAELEGLKAAFPNSEEDKLIGRSYGLAHQRAFDYFRMVLSSPVPYVVLTIWTTVEKNDPKDMSRDAPTHIEVDLAGKMAERFMGEFGLVFYSVPGQRRGPDSWSPGQWQTRRDGKVWAAGMKLPPEISRKIPTLVPQDWPAFEAMVEKAAREAGYGAQDEKEAGKK